MNPQMRKAAILVSSLDRAAAETLLAQMPKEFAKKVLAAAKQLGKITPQERSEVMRDFMSKKSGNPTPETQTSKDAEDVELSLSADADQKAASSHLAAGGSIAAKTESTSANQRFTFITEEWIEPLASLLGREQPQLAALILAHLPPERSAAILSLVAGPSRLGIVQRIAEIDETAPEVLDEIEQELRTRLVRERLKIEGSTAGLAALSGILQASNPELRIEISSAMSIRQAEKTAIAPPEDIEIAPQTKTEPDPNLVPDYAPNAVESDAVLPDHDVATQVIAFSGFTLLDDVSLAAIFGSVSPQVAILALVGAEEALVRRILKVLPRKEATAFRKKLDEVGPLRLKEVELAQTQLSEAAGALLKKRRISLPIPQRVRLAA